MKVFLHQIRAKSRMNGLAATFLISYKFAPPHSGVLFIIIPISGRK